MKNDNKRKRVLSLLMTLVLVVGLFVGIGTTAKAEPTTTDISLVDISGVIMPDAIQGPKFDAAVPAGAGYHIATDAELTALNWSEYKHGVNWWGDDEINVDLIEKFEAGKKYSLMVFLMAESGYTFRDDMTAKINGSVDNCQNVRVYNSGKVAIIHSVDRTATSTGGAPAATQLSSVEIMGADMPDVIQGPTFNATVPAGAGYHIATDTELTALNWPEYKHGVNWWGDDGINVGLIEKFEAGKKYSLIVFLMAESGYTFRDDMTAKINGSVYNCQNVMVYNSGKYAIIHSVYWTATEGINEIESVNLTMPVPKTGNRSSIGATTTESGYSVASTSWEVIDEVFKPNTVYTAIIKLEAPGADRFTNRTQFFVNGEKADLVAPNPIPSSVEEVTLSFTFPKTGASHICEGTKVSEQEATFTETGVHEHYECGCGKIYNDAECTDEITNPDTAVIPMKKYEIIEGMNEKFIKKAGKTLVFKANGPKKDCTGIKIDGKIVDPVYYTLESGSTIVTLKSEYLEKLSDGEHNIVVVYGDREEATAKFIINAVSASGGKTNPSKPGTTASPKTGDDRNMIIWIVLLLVACGGIVTALIIRKKKNQSK